MRTLVGHGANVDEKVDTTTDYLESTALHGAAAQGKSTTPLGIFSVLWKVSVIDF